jgi:hypothetical protein
MVNNTEQEFLSVLLFTFVMLGMEPLHTRQGLYTLSCTPSPFSFYFEIEFHSAAKAGLELSIPLPQPPKLLGLQAGITAPSLCSALS